MPAELNFQFGSKPTFYFNLLSLDLLIFQLVQFVIPKAKTPINQTLTTIPYSLTGSLAYPTHFPTSHL